MPEYGFLIPVYNHGKSAYAETQALLHYGLRIILVDDGSNAETKEWLCKAAGLSPLVTLRTLEKNLGKGGAVINGFAEAKKLALDYVLQLDADGQHDIGRIPHFLELSRQNPATAIIGYPEFDESAPKSRSGGRKVGNFFVHLATLNSDTIKDCMCGFRVYPVDKAYEVTSKGHWDYRMGFDIEVLVRLYWKRVPMISESVKVTYPEGGSSNFHIVRDNARISWVFTQLIVGGLFHLPSILQMRSFYAKHREGGQL